MLQHLGERQASGWPSLGYHKWTNIFIWTANLRGFSSCPLAPSPWPPPPTLHYCDSHMWAHITRQPVNHAFYCCSLNSSLFEQTGFTLKHYRFVLWVPNVFHSSLEGQGFRKEPLCINHRVRFWLCYLRDRDRLAPSVFLKDLMGLLLMPKTNQPRCIQSREQCWGQSSLSHLTFTEEWW